MAKMPNPVEDERAGEGAVSEGILKTEYLS